METRVIDVTPDSTAHIAAEALEVLVDCGVVAIPTDTVYGLAVRADDDRAVLRLFDVKGRPETNPLPILIPDAQFFGRVCSLVPEAALLLAERFWPGPLTLVVPKAPEISDRVTAGKKTVGVRVPDHFAARAVLAACPFPVAVSSANAAGDAPAVDEGQVVGAFSGTVELIIAAGSCPGGVPSTVVDVSGPRWAILRQGALSEEEIVGVLGPAPC
ncbi:MAG: L-threonylcarbamoyladenylate synthase [Acidobacteriota bacterium]|nr:L-threonylcarbamoyladenylate synthase [Acidobacteriota bacterium]